MVLVLTYFGATCAWKKKSISLQIMGQFFEIINQMLFLVPGGEEIKLSLIYNL